MKTTWIILLLTISFMVNGQTADSTTNEQHMVDYIGTAASFPGGTEGLKNYIEKHFSWTQETIKGKVLVEFWIEKTGEIKDVKVIRGLCDTCDKEALRLVTEMPKWTPAMQEEKAIRTRMVLPINFGL